MRCREFIENYKHIKESNEIVKYFERLKKVDPKRFKKELEAYNAKIEYANSFDGEKNKKQTKSKNNGK